MNKAQQKRFDSLYRKHLSALKRQGKAESTIDVYSRVIRRLTDYFDCPPDALNKEQLEGRVNGAVTNTASLGTRRADFQTALSGKALSGTLSPGHPPFHLSILIFTNFSCSLPMQPNPYSITQQPISTL